VEQSRYLIVLPTYDERENLPRMIDSLAAIRDQVPMPGEVLVVDDGSPDGTGQAADQLVARHDWLHVLHRPAKQGLGRAYLAGFEWALQRPFSHVIEMDCDLSHPVSALPAMLEASRHADLVLGSRYTAGGGVDGWPLHRRFISRGGCTYARLVLGVPIHDLTGGFKCFRRSVLEALDLERVHADGYGFQIELTYRAIRAGFTVREIPIVFRDRERGTSKMSPMIAAEAVLKVPALRFGSRRVRS
jgi:dolichol-phosphate mannosyltransferase